MKKILYFYSVASPFAYLGMVKAGRLGGFLAGLGFMLPGFD